MTSTVERPSAPDPVTRFGSDLVVDVLRALGTRYVALNPGSSFRGLHDSLVNHGGNTDPQLLLCLHEEIAVSLAHGYAKGSGQVGVAAVHDLVGLMHASMAVYDAFCDRAPLLVLGGSGPADPAQRRPIDWIHSATTQAQLVRDFVAWDAEPATPAAFVADVLARTPAPLPRPAGPTYVSLDAGAQEAELTEPVPLPDLARSRPRRRRRPTRRAWPGPPTSCWPRSARWSWRARWAGSGGDPAAGRAGGAARRRLPRRPQRGLVPHRPPAERHRRRRRARRSRRARSRSTSPTCRACCAAAAGARRASPPGPAR